MKKRTKILFCMETLAGGGAEKNLISILKRMNPEQYEIDLLLLRKEGVYLKDIPDYVTWYELRKDDGRLSTNFDIEIAFMEGHPTRYIAYRDSNAIKIAWVRIDLLSMHWTKYVYKSDLEEKWCYSRFNKLLFVSHQAKNQFNKLFALNDIPQHVTYNIINKNEIRQKAAEYPVTKNKLTLCTIGRLVPQKGYIALIHTLNRLFDEGLDFECWILGEGYQKDKLTQLINFYSLHENVLLKGFHKNPFPYLEAADIFISSSVAEGYSLVTAEAICLHKPIISTSTAGPTELLGNGAYGLLTDTSPEALYQGIRKMMTNESLRTYYKNKAEERSLIFSPQEKMREIMNLIHKEETNYSQKTD